MANLAKINPGSERLLTLTAIVSDGVLDLTPAAVFVCDRAGGVVRCNDSAIELWGRHPQPGEGPLSRGRAADLLEECLQSGRPVRDRELVIVRPDGSQITALVSINPARGPSGEIVGAVSCLHDITERKRIEGRLQASHDELDDFFENGVVALHWVAADGTILRANRAELHMLGYTREEYVGRNISEFHVDRHVIDDILARLARGEKLDKYPARVRAKDGAVKQVEISSDARFEAGDFVHTRCFTVNVTDQQRMAEELRESARELAESREELAIELAATQRLQSISTELVREQGLDALLDKIVDAAAVIMRSQFASMQLLSRAPDGREALQLLAFRGFTREAAKFWKWVRVDSRSTCGGALSSGRRVVVPDVTRCDFMAGSDDLTMSLETGMRAMQSTPLISRSGRLLGMISTHWCEPYEPPETDLRRLDVLARQAADLIERAQAEEDRARLAAIVQSSDDAIIGKDLSGVIRSWNASAERMFGYSPQEAIGQSVSMLIPEGRLDEELEIIRRIRLRERVYHLETVRRRKDGALIDVSLTISPVADANGAIVGASTIARDITERKTAEESQRLLLKEMSHRVKNLFAIAASVVTLSARGARSTEELATTIRERLIALRKAHELVRPALTETGVAAGPTSTTLDALVKSLFASYALNGDERIVSAGPPIPIGSRAASSIALVLHELGTNAVKHGALSAPGGSVAIDWSLADGEVLVAWRERGGPPVSGAPQEEGFGSQLVRASVGGQLRGEISQRWNPEGLEVDLALPLDRLIS